MEGKQVLNKSVEAEWTTGLSDLPAFEFSPYFRMKLEKLMKKSVEGKKDWLTTLKMARELYKDRNVREDEFDANDTLRDWIVLPSKKEKLKTSEALQQMATWQVVSLTEAIASPSNGGCLLSPWCCDASDE